MQSLSSHKYQSQLYYRYQIKESEPVTLEAHQRRLKKAAKGPTTHLLVDLTQLQNLEKLDPSLIKDHHAYTVHFLCKAALFEGLQTQNQINPQAIYLFAEDLADLQACKKVNTRYLAGFLFSPKTSKDLKEFIVFEQLNLHSAKIFWSLRPYNKNIKNSLTLKEIQRHKKQYQTLAGLEIINTEIPENFELVSLSENIWQYSSPQKNLKISLIIPTFNNILFLTNVLNHLFQQTLSKENYEVIVVDDGSTDNTSEIIKSLFHNLKDQINLKLIHWPKQHPTRGHQFFFRAGLARNLGVFYSESENILFLDSDMITPPQFIETALAELQKSDLIQFQRYHIKQKLSLLNPNHRAIQPEIDTYVEESSYWNTFFTSKNWMRLPNYWKYTCTYALGMSKKNFLDYGGFKKYYVSYGFEDTDLGYCFFKKNKTFKMIQLPLYHLTAYDQMQYKNSQINRFKLLRKTASLFYLQHLDASIYHLFGNFFRFEKPILNSLKDLVSFS